MEPVTITHARVSRMFIGGLAERTDVKSETIRYYERIGLMPAPPRSQTGQRLYDQKHVQRLVFIRRARELGFPIADVRELLDCAEISSACCGRTRDIALRNLSEVQEKIASLKNLEQALRAMTDACEPNTDNSCPILDALSPQPEMHELDRS